MDYTLFVIGSTLEYFVLFVFMLTLFRFKLKKRVIHVALISFLMSQVSFFIRLDSDLGAFSSYVQYALSIVVLIVLFRVPLKYSVIMNVASIMYGLLVQGLILLAVRGIAGMSIAEVQENSTVMAATQTLTTILFLASSWTIVRFNLGFNYVPTSFRYYEHVTKNGAIITAISVTSIAITGITAFLLRHDLEDVVIITISIYIITLPLFLYYSFRKDVENVR